MNAKSFDLKWDHIHIRTTDVEKAAEWFRKHLGAEVLRTSGRTDLKLGGANIFLAPVAEGDQVGSAPCSPYQGLDHFGLSVSNIDELASRLKLDGVEFSKEPVTARPGVRACFIRGPHGISIELLERNSAYK